jgi:hypothetical protein
VSSTTTRNSYPNEDYDDDDDEEEDEEDDENDDDMQENMPEENIKNSTTEHKTEHKSAPSNIKKQTNSKSNTKITKSKKISSNSAVNSINGSASSDDNLEISNRISYPNQYTGGIDQFQMRQNHQISSILTSNSNNTPMAFLTNTTGYSSPMTTYNQQHSYIQHQPYNSLLSTQTAPVSLDDQQTNAYYQANFNTYNYGQPPQHIISTNDYANFYNGQHSAANEQLYQQQYLTYQQQQQQQHHLLINGATN